MINTNLLNNTTNETVDNEEPNLNVDNFIESIEDKHLFTNDSDIPTKTIDNLFIANPNLKYLIPLDDFNKLNSYTVSSIDYNNLNYRMNQTYLLNKTYLDTEEKNDPNKLFDLPDGWIVEILEY